MPNLLALTSWRTQTDTIGVVGRALFMHVAEHAVQLESCFNSRYVKSLVSSITIKHQSEMCLFAGRAVVTSEGDKMPHCPLKYFLAGS